MDKREFIQRWILEKTSGSEMHLDHADGAYNAIERFLTENPDVRDSTSTVIPRATVESIMSQIREHVREGNYGHDFACAAGAAENIIARILPILVGEPDPGETDFADLEAIFYRLNGGL